jgi:hypothetical protein
MQRPPLPPRLVSTVTALLVMLWGAAAAAATSHNYWLAMQEEFSARRGFTLMVRSNADTGPLTLAHTVLQFNVGQGTSWLNRSFKPAAGWQLDRDYVVKAVISPTSMELWLDGQRVVQAASTAVPAADLDMVKAGYVYDNSGTPDFMVRQLAMRMSTSTGRQATAVLPTLSAVPPEVYLFSAHTPVALPWRLQAGETLTLDTTFRFIRRPLVQNVQPMVDAYGQSRHAQWAGKVSADTQLFDAAADETRRHQAWGLPTGYDAYGGYTGTWKETATGYYRVVRRDARWWLITPLGTPIFYFGLDSAPGLFEGTRVTGRTDLFEWLPPREGLYSTAWSGDMFSFATANVIRKHGAAWSEPVRDNTVSRMKYWGFSGVGKWSGDIRRTVPRVQVLRRDGVPTLGGGHPDIFDANVRTQLEAKIQAGVSGASNPDFLIGWSLGNEHEEIILTSEIPAILGMGPAVPAKRALVDHALATVYGGSLTAMGTAWQVTGSPLTRDTFYAATTAQPPAEDVETLRQFFADRYYAFIYATFKKLAPNHLYMGFWIMPGWWESEDDWRIMARHVDVIGLDRYAFNYDNAQVQRLLGEADKPYILGEFSFPAHYSATRGVGATTGAAMDETHAGALYEKWTQAAAKDPYCIGQMWFQYRDQPITGRDNRASTALTLGEHFPFGVVDITDRPKWPLVTAMRRAHLAAVGQRLADRSILQAESAVRTGAVVDTAREGYTGTGYVDFVGASGDSVEWTVSVATAGTYRLVFRYANGGTESRPLELRVDNAVVGSLPFPQTADWTTWSTQSHTLALGAGTHKVRLTATGLSGGNIDYLQLTDTGAP